MIREQFFPNETKGSLLTQKGIYSYSYMDFYGKFEEKNLLSLA